ncbi:GNAT family N-acetyltransferase [Granulicella arctica]|uniref:Ribosomal protein S18 acetylase RimI-like enzyme n=1 Tax=Granulicella arctica TaxID=940613 RepID=A0A7Y9PFA7_9BACT|nr:GNAT family N-acetyltransferase [Granulicella arctica]NYF78856.1 ribosomal protein S18 acetylase RimI-like enzyme [Granulicella arctica]
MAFTIRPGELGDAAGIALVHVQSWKSTYRGIVPDTYLAALEIESRAEMWKGQLLSGDSLIFVAEDESGVVGFAAAGSLRESVDDYDAELYAIYLLDTRQRQGAGRMLVHALAVGLRARGFKSFLVWVLEQNPSVSFYKSLGGVQVAQKSVEIGGVYLPEIACGWSSIDQLVL